MKAVILAAGLGKRLRPLTEWTPKPMLLVGGRPILARTMEALPDEIDEVIFVINYLGEQIRAYFGDEWRGAGAGPRKIRYVHHAALNGTGGAVACARPLLNATNTTTQSKITAGRDDRFLVLMGDDMYSARDLERLLQFPRAVLGKEVSDPERFGTLTVTAQDDLSGIAEAGSSDRKPPYLVNCAAYVLDQHYFDVPPVKLPSGELGLPQTLAQLPVLGHSVRVVRAKDWLGIGTIEELTEVNRNQ